MAWSTHKKLLIVHLTILAICSTISAVDHRKRYITNDHHTPTQSIFDSQKLINNNNNEFATESEIKIGHGLMGGHKKISTTKGSEEAEDEARWDDGLFLSSAGNGKEKKLTRDEDDDKKTLAQQVKEGKYGLIQNEIYSNKPKRPGIISYMSNPDVPKDNIKNLGGLEKEDIWLAENHLLVLRGGKFPDHETEELNDDFQEWSPIDNYQAPKRQVRIPSQPEIPPPFPVQFTDGGPIRIIGKNETDNHENGSQWIEGLVPYNSTSLTFTDNQSNETNEEIIDGKTKSEIFGGIVGPFFPHLPPGAVFVPPPNNQSDFDEDDQSIYYPPPYSFKYSQDNATAVPPGPLVPGIILPPPPDFFAELDEKKATAKSHTKCIRCISTSSSTKSSPVSLKSITKPYKISSNAVNTKGTIRPFTMKPISKLKYKATPFVETTSKYSEKPTKYIEVTTTPLTKINTIEISEIQPVKSTIINHLLEPKSEEQRNHWTGTYNKSRPIVAYYPTSTPSNYNSVEATPVSLKTIINTEKKPGNSASYYFYEEANSESSGITTNPTVYRQKTTPATIYQIEELAQPESNKKNSYYNIEITPSQQTAEEYRVEVIEPIIKSSPKYQYTNSLTPTKFPRVQGQRMLSDSSPSIYYQSTTERSNYNLPSLFTTPNPKGFAGTSPTIAFKQKTKSKPIYQYSFTATNYPQQHHAIYKQEVVDPPKQQITFNEWQEIQNQGQVFDYETGTDDEIIEEPQYKSKHDYHISVTTPNPTHAYYTKQDEQLFDDVTKEYFTNFGKKIKYQKLPSTTPIYEKSTTEKPIHPTYHAYITNNAYETRPTASNKAPKVKVFYGDQSNKYHSIKDDIRVNYQHPLPAINPDAEFLPGYNPKQHETLAPIRSQQQQSYHYAQPNLSNQRLVPIISYNGQQVAQQRDSTPTGYLPISDNKNDNQNYLQQPISLAGDVAVNYHNPRPPINPDAEFINPTTGQAESTVQPRSYYTYRLPGDSGHVYFFTPIIAHRQDAYLSTRRGSRSPRRRRGPGV